MASLNAYSYYFQTSNDVVEILQFLKDENLLDKFMFFDRNATVDYLEDFTAGNWLLNFIAKENLDDNLDFEDELDDKGAKKVSETIKSEALKLFDRDWSTVVTDDKSFVCFNLNLDQFEEMDRKIRLKMMNAECDIFGNGESDKINCNYWWIKEQEIKGKQLREYRIKEIVEAEGFSIIEPYQFK
ncbi:MAG: hypothetical protein ACTSVY_02330 [Candidatus Helarchaeota archaeon]